MGELHVICPHRQAQRKQIFFSDRKADGQKKKSILLVMGYGKSLSGKIFCGFESSMLKFHPTGLHKSKTRWVDTSDEGLFGWY